MKKRMFYQVMTTAILAVVILADWLLPSSPVSTQEPTWPTVMGLANSPLLLLFQRSVLGENVAIGSASLSDRFAIRAQEAPNTSGLSIGPSAAARLARGQCVHVTTVVPPIEGTFLPVILRNSGGTPTPWTGPTIREVTEDTGGCLKFVGDTIHFTLNASEAGGISTVDIGQVHKGIRLYDDGTHGDTMPGDGVYELDYVAAASDIVRTVRIVGHFTSSAGKSAPAAQSEGRVTIVNWDSGESSLDGEVSTDNIVENPDGVKYISDRLVISFALGTSWNDVSTIIEKYNLKLASWLPRIWAFEVELEEGEDREMIRLQVLGEPTVEAVDYSILGQIDASPTVIHDSEIIAQSDYLNTIRAKLGWQITKGIPSVKVGILDTGIDSDHPDLWGQIQSTYQESYEDEDGHGTAVAGIVAAEDENGGISGVAPNVKLAIGKNLKGIDTEDFLWLSGSDLLVKMADSGTKVVNMSWGNYTSFVNTVPLSRAIDYAYERDVVLVASAGNEPREMIKADSDSGWHGKETHYPSSYSKVLAVGATDTITGDNRWSESAWGDQVIYAPGVSICTTVKGGDFGGDWRDPANLCSNGSGEAGTSLAAPQVAALAALLRSANTSMPNWQVTQIITQTADPGPGGLGRINIYRALTKVTTGTDPGEVPLPGEVTNLDHSVDHDANGFYVHLTWTPPGDDYSGVHIYRLDKVAAELVLLEDGLIAGSEYDDHQVGAGKWYAYYVFSVDAIGQESAVYQVTRPIIPSSDVTMDQINTSDYWGNPKSTFRPGEAIEFGLLATNHTTRTVSVTYTWDIYNPNGTKVSHLSWDSPAQSMLPGEDDWYLKRGIATNALLGTYTYTATVSYASGRSARSAPFVVQGSPISINLLQALTCKDVQSNKPVSVTDTFTTGDARVYAWAALEGVTIGAHTIRWEWYRPNGTLYYTLPYDFDAIDDALWYLWAWLSVPSMGNNLGQWSIKIYMDGAYMGTRYFTLAAGAQSQTGDQLQLSAPEIGGAGSSMLQPASALPKPKRGNDLVP